MNKTIDQGGVADPKYFIGEREMLGFEAADNELLVAAGSIGFDLLADLYGVEDLPTDTEERLMVLQGIAATHWDFRKGAERQQVEWDDATVDVEGSNAWEAIFSAGSMLGLVQDTTPIDDNPNSLIILGGANRAPFDRMRYGLENVANFGQVAYLGSSRPVSDAEREKTAEYAPEAVTEFELGVGALETLVQARKIDETTLEIEIDGEASEGNLHTYELDFNGERKTALMVNTPLMINAPHMFGERRANTYDNYRFFAGAAGLDEDSEHVAVAVTTGFYTAGQHLPGVQELTLPYNTELETIGHSAAYSGVTRKASQLLMETKAMVDAAVLLQQKLAQVEIR